jgi:hypothetical protein
MGASPQTPRSQYRMLNVGAMATSPRTQRIMKTTKKAETNLRTSQAEALMGEVKDLLGTHHGMLEVCIALYYSRLLVPFSDHPPRAANDAPLEP